VSTVLRTKTEPATPATAAPNVAAPNATERPQPLACLYAPIAAEMAEVERRLREEMRSEFPYVDELVRYGVLLGGKRLRPALLFLAAKACGQVTSAHYTLATVVEMIHTATLVHDDVLDEAALRRHLATVNARWDNEASILLGDFLFSHAFCLAATVDAAACRQIGRATNIVCEGELRQKGSRGRFALPEPEYFGIIDAKTAELTACSCRLGAQYAGATEVQVEALASFGRDLGIAFQIADDLLDLQRQEQVTGKSLGTDLDKQKPTLPVIHALAHATPADQAAMLDLLSSDQPRVGDLRPMLLRYDSLAYAQGQAQRFLKRAIAQLDHLPPSPCRDVLALTADFVLTRSA
jgi:octaprenyl-diphosphate synthase